MKRLLIPPLAVGFTTIASADPVNIIAVQPTAPAKSWIDDVLPPGAVRPMAIDTHNCLGRYPEQEKAAHVEGITGLDFRIAEDGSVKNVSVRKSSGNKALDNAAVACVKVWQYKPAMLQDKPVEVAWRNDVKWVISINPAVSWQPPRAMPPGPPPPPPVNTITLQSNAKPPVISIPASIGRPHVCLAMYPPSSVAEQEQGTVTVGFTITTEGATEGQHVIASSGYAALDDAAVACTLDWRYKPAVKDNQPIAVPWKAEVKWLMH